MASVADIRKGPRFGSAAEVATYAGLSSKTIRRLIDAGKLRGLRVGRRVLIPFEDVDDLLLLQIHAPGSPTMPATLTSPSVDARGRALPLDPEQARYRQAEALRALDDLDSMGDEAEQRATFTALVAAVEEDRARFGG